MTQDCMEKRQTCRKDENRTVIGKDKRRGIGAFSRKRSTPAQFFSLCTNCPGSSPRPRGRPQKENAGKSTLSGGSEKKAQPRQGSNWRKKTGDCCNIKLRRSGKGPGEPAEFQRRVTKRVRREQVNLLLDKKGGKWLRWIKGMCTSRERVCRRLPIGFNHPTRLAGGRTTSKTIC